MGAEQEIALRKFIRLLCTLGMKWRRGLSQEIIGCSSHAEGTGKKKV